MFFLTKPLLSVSKHISGKQIFCFSEASLLHRSHIILVTITSSCFVVQRTRNVEQVLLMIFEGESRRRVVLLLIWTSITGESEASGFDWPTRQALRPWESSITSRGVLFKSTSHRKSLRSPLIRHSSVRKPFWSCSFAEFSIGWCSQSFEPGVLHLI